MNKTVEQLRDPRYIRVFSGLGRVGIEVAIFGNENANKIQAVCMDGEEISVIQTQFEKLPFWRARIRMRLLWL